MPNRQEIKPFEHHRASQPWIARSGDRSNGLAAVDSQAAQGSILLGPVGELETLGQQFRRHFLIRLAVQKGHLGNSATLLDLTAKILQFGH